MESAFISVGASGRRRDFMFYLTHKGSPMKLKKISSRGSLPDGGNATGPHMAPTLYVQRNPKIMSLKDSKSIKFSLNTQEAPSTVYIASLESFKAHKRCTLNQKADISGKFIQHMHID